MEDKGKKKRAIYMKKWREAHKKEQQEYRREYATRPGFKERRNQRQKENYAKNPKRLRNAGLIYKFGISQEDYDSLLLSQGGKCAICKRLQTDFPQAFAVDHDHMTKNIRGLLCARCNTGIGLLRDNIDILRSAVKYLQKHQKEIKKQEKSELDL